MGPWRAVGILAAGTLCAGLLTACAGDPPQIVAYSPLRNTVDVSTVAPVNISFDHDVDRASVESRLHLQPAASGSIRWLNGRHLVYEHATLRTNTSYDVILEPGYHDLAGNTYTLRHHWSFLTEGPPTLASSAPANGDSAVDPSAYLNLDFTRGMDAKSLKSAISISPSAPFDVRIDPGEPRRAVIAPSELLEANTDYKVLVNTAASDVDGNQLARNELVHFTTGQARSLTHWIAFATDSSDGSPGGLWIVNERGFPRQLFDASGVRSYTWSPAGDSLIIQGADGSWWRSTPGGGDSPLNLKAGWAASLANGMGYVYIDNTAVLHRQSADGADEVIANDVAEATVAPNGLRVAYVHEIGGSNEVWGYDVGLRASYQLVMDTARVSSVAWSPAGNRLAYLRHDPNVITLRMRSLVGAAATTTLASGEIATPEWLPDSSHLVFSAAIKASSGTVHKAYVINVVSPPAGLTLSAGLPADPAIEVASPVSSPDGHQIAFLSGNQVWLMNADGTRPTALTKQDPASFPYSCRALAWTRT